jgi:hypothetical protein
VKSWAVTVLDGVDLETTTVSCSSCSAHPERQDDAARIIAGLEETNGGSVW